MPTNRTRRTRGRAKGGITAEALEAFQRGDYLALHHALDLGPGEVSPLEVSDDPADRDRCTGKGTVAWSSWPMAVELRRALIEAGGVDPEGD